jgi:hypothetical protein
MFFPDKIRATDVEIETIKLSSRVNARDAAQGLVFGSPFRSEIERRDPSALDRAVEAVAQALVRWDGKDAPIVSASGNRKFFNCNVVRVRK